MTRTPTNYDKNQQSIAGQEEDGSDCDLELKDRSDSELPKVTKIKNLLRGLVDADKDKRGAADYDARALATQAALGSHSDLDAVATSKEQHASDCVGGGNEDSMLDQEKLSGKGIVPGAVRIIDPIDRLAPIDIKYKRPLHNLVKASLEMSETPQNELVEEIGKLIEAGLNKLGKTKGDGPEAPHRSTSTQADVPVTNDIQESYETVQKVFKVTKAGAEETEDAGPEEMPRDTAQEDGTAKDTEGDGPDELMKEPSTERSVSKKIYENMSGNPEDPLRSTAAREDVTASLPLRRTQLLRKKAQKAKRL